MKHPSLSRKSAIFVNIFLILILTILIIFSSYSLNEDIQFIDNEGINNITKEEIIGNINQSRIINADSEPHNWLAHGRDYNEQRLSPLKKINKENISQLELEWSVDMDTTRGLEATPIVDNGVMFVTNAWSTVHAIDAKTGKEIWGFIPPLIAPNLPLVMNTNLNQPREGGSNAIFGVDGSIVQHDMFFKTPGTTALAWHTILFVHYGRGGAGFSVLEVTNTAKPLHLY